MVCICAYFSDCEYLHCACDTDPSMTIQRQHMQELITRSHNLALQNGAVQTGAAGWLLLLGLFHRSGSSVFRKTSNSSSCANFDGHWPTALRRGLASGLNTLRHTSTCLIHLYLNRCLDESGPLTYPSDACAFSQGGGPQVFIFSGLKRMTLWRTVGVMPPHCQHGGNPPVI